MELRLPTVAFSRATEPPAELAVSFLMIAIATTLQGKFRALVWEGYFEELALGFVTYCASGERKTAIHKLAVAPLLQWEQETNRSMNDAIRDALSRKLNQEARVRALRKKYATCRDQVEREELERTILNEERNQIEVPVPPRLIVEDVTPEKLCSLLGQHKERLSIISDEAGIFDLMCGRYNDQRANLDIFLKAFSGSPYITDRQSRECIPLSRPVLSFGVSPQPIVLDHLAARKELRGHGVLARFVHLFPISRVGFRENKFERVDGEILKAYHFLIFRLLSAGPQNKNECIDVSFESKAAIMHKLKLQSLEDELKEGGQLEHLRDWANKLMGTIARIATIYKLIETPNLLSCATQTVDPETYKRAAQLIPCFKAHAFRTFGYMSSKESERGAERILEWAQQLGTPTFSGRDCFNALKHVFHSMKEFRLSIDLLREHNYLGGVAYKPETGRPSQRFLLNPDLTKPAIGFADS